MKWTVTAASARKWANRSTSRLVLSIGYIHSLSQVGTKRPSGSTYQVKVTKNAKTRYMIASASTARERRAADKRCAPPSAHHAPNTNSNCQANGLKNHCPFGYAGRFQSRFHAS